MCGICGFAGDGTVDDLRRMTRILAHRGPDDSGLWHDLDRGVFLGHRRLSIIDLADGVQPMWTVDLGLGVVYNGEIYNHLELRRALVAAGHRFVTDHSDTEVLLHGYREWGGDLVRRLNGMWAFALYDRARNELFLSRDRFGQKPLYYTRQHGVFAFASELHALTEHGRIAPSRSVEGMRKLFAYGYIPAPHTSLAGVRKLPAGHSMTVSVADLQVCVRRYWDFVLEPFEEDEIPCKPEEVWGERLRVLLRQAVSRRLMSDVPLGVFLSGGIDSSAIAAYAVAEAGAGAVQSFSIGFEEASFDESVHAKRVADRLGTEHHCRTLSLERARPLLATVAAKLDEPMGDSSLLPTYLLCQETRREVTVALGGDAGDELLAGYDPFRALGWARLYRRIVPKALHPGVRALLARLPVSHRNMSLDFKIKRALRGVGYPRPFWNALWLAPLDPGEIAELLQAPCDLEQVYSEAIEAWDACPQVDLVDKTLQFYTKLYLQDDILVKVDRASMMHSLEVRSPFLDIDFVDFVRRIPSRYKFRNGVTKYIFRKAMAPVLSRETIEREKKGFGVPIGAWFQCGELTVDPEAPALRGLHRPFVRRLVEEHRQGRCDHRAALWNLWLVSHMRQSA